MNKQVMQRALDALEHHAAQTRPIEQTSQVIAELRAAIAAPEVEPVAWRTKESDEKKAKILDDWFYASNPAYIKVHKYKWQPLYAAPAVQSSQAGENQDAMFTGRHKFLEWNREQKSKPIPGATEYFVFDNAVRIYLAAIAAQGGGV